MLSNTVKMLHIGFRYCKPFSSLNSNQLWTLLIGIKLTVKIENEQALFSRLKGDINRNQQLPLKSFSSAFPSEQWALWDCSWWWLQSCLVSPMSWLLPLPFHPLLPNCTNKTRKESRYCLAESTRTSPRHSPSPVTESLLPCWEHQGSSHSLPLFSNMKPARKGGASEKCSE